MRRFTKKQVEFVATVLREQDIGSEGPDAQAIWTSIVNTFATRFEQGAENFNKDRFLRSCRNE